MGMSERSRFFSWSWDWQDWRLPQTILSHIGLLDRTQAESQWEDDKGHLNVDAGLADLTEVADELTRLIQPALPDPSFRAGLKLALITAHEQNSSWGVAFHMGPDTPWRPWQVIATVPVLVGVVALIWRYRQRTDAQPSQAA